MSERIGIVFPSAFSRNHTTLFGKCYFLLPNSVLLFLELTLVFVWIYLSIYPFIITWET